MAATRTSDLIPLCHPLALTHAAVELAVVPGGIDIEASVATTAPTGVEMEALTAVTIAGLTLYDMLKSVERGAHLTDVRLVEKTGGESGTVWATGRSPRGASPGERRGRARGGLTGAGPP